jgi:23S rRNA (adenine1618-N6)-methyltransferase
MHPRNRHQDRYDLKELIRVCPELKAHVIVNKFGDESIDFANSVAVKALNRALLKSFYGIEFWDIPSEFLTPPIPGRADLIHSAADLFPDPKNLRVLDIGTGANLIYPIIGFKEYNWQMVGTDIDLKALANAERIIEKNNLPIELRHQKDKNSILKGIIDPREKFDLTICNPPFHESLAEASAGTERKWKNLGKKPAKNLNFGGQGAELWTPGGEKAFILKMIEESVQYKNQVTWFTALVSKATNLTFLTKSLEKLGAKTKIIEMTQGQKKSRILCWKIT